MFVPMLLEPASDDAFLLVGHRLDGRAEPRGRRSDLHALREKDTPDGGVSSNLHTAEGKSASLTDHENLVLGSHAVTKHVVCHEPAAGW